MFFTIRPQHQQQISVKDRNKSSAKSNSSSPSSLSVFNYNSSGGLSYEIKRVDSEVHLIVSRKEEFGPSDVDISLVNNSLVLQISHQFTESHQEFSGEKITRSGVETVERRFSLPDGVGDENIKAEIKGNSLSIYIVPPTPKIVSKKIPVSLSSSSSSSSRPQLENETASKESNEDCGTSSQSADVDELREDL